MAGTDLIERGVWAFDFINMDGALCRNWQLAGRPLGIKKLRWGYTQMFGYSPGVWIPNQGYIRVMEYAQAFGSPNGATYK